MLREDRILIVPGAADTLVAKIIEKSGFKALYLTGAGVSYTSLGSPDIGLTSFIEILNKAWNICSSVTIPVIVDCDNGFGNALNVRRTVAEFERAGVAAIQLEDQVFPKRCGHLKGKQLISKQEMIGKIKAALDTREDENFAIIARTDARAVEGMSAALDRAVSYQEAGADIIFVEAPESEEDMKRINQTIKAPTMANMVEGGKTPMIKAEKLKNLGYKIVIFPNSAIRAITKTVQELMEIIKNDGSTERYLNKMCMFDEINTLLGLNEIIEIGKKYSVNHGG